jgi:quercetin 2,3-dioxygenase
VIDARLDHSRRRSAGLSEVNMAGGTAPLRVLLYAGRALREPVVERGPFVMNTEGHIRQAYIDYRAGRFRLIGQ